jgi:hypothetical protein
MGRNKTKPETKPNAYSFIFNDFSNGPFALTPQKAENLSDKASLHGIRKIATDVAGYAGAGG